MNTASYFLLAIGKGKYYPQIQCWGRGHGHMWSWVEIGEHMHCIIPAPLPILRMAGQFGPNYDHALHCRVDTNWEIIHAKWIWYQRERHDCLSHNVPAKRKGMILFYDQYTTNSIKNFVDTPTPIGSL